MIAYAGPIQLLGGLLLIAFGVGLLFTRPALAIAHEQKSRLWEHTGTIPQTFFLTVTNPGAILGMAAMIGGLGSLWGTLLGGVVLGVAQQIGAQINISYEVLAGYIVFLAVLVIRPEGLTTRRTRS